MGAKSGLHLYTSNRLENLAGVLAERLREPLAEVFTRDLIVVQSLGMERWLTQQLARAHGISANVSFLFPQRFVAQLFDQTLPGKANAEFYTRENLSWRIMALLPELVRQNSFADLRRYLDGPRPELRRFQLAEKIAASFDRYLAFRPRMIREWDEGKDDDNWQAVLWRALVASAQGLHPPALAEKFRAALQQGAATLPARLSLFGISTLPPFYLEFFGELARHTRLDLFVLRPTPEFWSDLRSPREETRARRKASASRQLDLQFERADPSGEDPNPLLKSLGKLGREFLDKVTELDFHTESDSSVLPDERRILGRIQADIFAVRDSSRAGKEKTAIAGDDRSLQFHSCHSPMREMEVLHDQLLDLFQKNPDLKPHDVIVMAPDISVYAPFVEAVFKTAPEAQRIPVSVADRGARAENGVIDTFLRILELAGSRFTASSVVAILESVALQRRFELAEPDLEIIRSWIEKTGIRWGIDAAHRASFDLPAFAENSWRAGLDRLLLGYAAPARNEQLFEGILAFDDVEGNLAETLGHFVEFAEALFATARELQTPRSLSEWETALREISLRFFPTDDEREPELRQLRRVIDSLGKSARLSGFAEALPLDVLLAHLDKTLAGTESASGFLVGRVTFCALKPMRAIPFRVVCLVGMNDTAYPRHDRPPAFDLVAQKPQAGDRNTRDDDRYLFLEALLSARDVLYLSYVGQSIRDNSPIPPSVLVSELLDHARETSIISTTTQLVRKHRLQPFSPAYFRPGSGLFSYSTENCAASAVAVAESHDPPPFISSPLPEPEADWRKLDTEQLIRFYGNPAKFLLEQRLSLRLPRAEELLEESEAFEMNTLTKYKLEQEFVARALRGESLAPLLPVLHAKGELPLGHAGEASLRGMADAAGEFKEVVGEYLAEKPDKPRNLELALNDFVLRARLDKLHRGRLVHYRLTKRKPGDLLTAWINHLVANFANPTESVLIAVDKENRPVPEHFPSIEAKEAVAHLRSLLNLYWRGLREPLHFFPRSSLAFVEQTLKPKGDSSALEKALAKWNRSPEPWEPDRGEKPESKDRYFDFVFGNVSQPLNDDFEQLALAVFAPLLKGMRS